MAFRQPQQRPQPARQVSYATSGEQAEASTRPSLQRTSTKHTLEDEEWILFSPTAPSTTQTDTTSTDRTPRTAGLSRLSDFGSLDTAARSDQISGDIDDNVTEQATEADEEAELDSLDDGLHAFHEPSDYGSPRRILERSGETVLPTHDGMGMFGDTSAAIQTQLWQFERESQRRKQRRRTSSVQRTLEALEEVEEMSDEQEKIRRIENWRMEQSRALIEEIERETRRMRRMSRANSTRSRTGSVNFQTKSETNFSAASSVAEEPQQHEPVPEPEVPEESESFWKRVTRRVIRSLIGIDDELLSVILGESLPTDSRMETDSSPTQDITKDPALDSVSSAPLLSDSWEHRLLDRVARELGILVHQLSEHPGAFATYLRAQETPLYAGLPNTSANSRPTIERVVSSGHQSHVPLTGGLFAPTIPQHSQSEASLFGIEEEPEPQDILSAQTEADREYWERELDVNMVFNFLKSRFSSGPNSPEPESVPYAGGGDYFSALENRRASMALSTSTQRAALIRQHHPLVSRNSDPTQSSTRKRERERYHVHNLHHGGQTDRVMRNRFVAHGRTASSSCASQSTKKSRKTGSSRNYWDLGGSVGSGHANGLGAWGEV